MLNHGRRAGSWARLAKGEGRRRGLSLQTRTVQACNYSAYILKPYRWRRVPSVIAHLSARKPTLWSPKTTSFIYRALLQLIPAESVIERLGYMLCTPIMTMLRLILTWPKSPGLRAGLGLSKVQAEPSSPESPVAGQAGLGFWGPGSRGFRAWSPALHITSSDGLGEGAILIF